MKMHFDFEVFSEVIITDAPLDVYASHASTKIILCAYAFDNGPVTVVENSTPEFRDGLKDPSVTLVAWNVNYERTILRGRGLDIPIARWLDPMAHARYAGLPGKLKDCAKIPMIGVPPNEATKNETLLIKKFCLPNKEGKRNLPASADEDWGVFVDYCRKDVLTMRHILNFLEPRFPFPERERRLWELDQLINSRGIPVDTQMARHGMREAERMIQEKRARMQAITGLENSNSVMQLHPWLQERGYQYDSLGKEFLGQALNDNMTPDGREMIELRLEAAKASVKKFAVLAEQAS